LRKSQFRRGLELLHRAATLIVQHFFCNFAGLSRTSG
jgi:hypothetical protein